MSKGRGFRGPRRRGFDDDSYSPQPDAWGGGSGSGRRQERPAPSFSPPTADGPAQEATVKWFNGEKGFGFAELADGSGDVFMHIAVLQAAGHEAVAPGTKLKVTVGQGQKGRQVTSVLEVDASTATAEAPRRSEGPRPPRAPREAPDLSSAADIDGVVKWFNPEKGFGFVNADDGDKDVFVHISVVERAGLRELAEGQRLNMKVARTPKGREAVSIAIA